MASASLPPRAAAGPAASIVIPVRNRAEQIVRSVQSVLAQTVVDLEVVVVDDGSDDNTAAVAGAIADPRVRVVSMPESRGPGGARNAGVMQSSGPLVGFLDSDDVVTPDWLERLSAPFEAPDVVAATCGYARIVDGRELDRLPAPLGLGPAFHDIRACFQAGTFLVRRSAFEAIGGYVGALRFGENTELALRLCDWTAMHHQRIAAVDDALLHWTMRDEKGYPPALRANAARYTLEHHHSLLALDRFMLSAHYAIVGHGAAHSRQWSDARRQFFRAWRAQPRQAKAIGRLALSCVPVLRDRQWQ